MTEMLSENGTFRLCQVCESFYRSGTYKDHQREDQHIELKAERDRERNARYQAEWRQRQRGLRHSG